MGIAQERRRHADVGVVRHRRRRSCSHRRNRPPRHPQEVRRRLPRFRRLPRPRRGIPRPRGRIPGSRRLPRPRRQKLPRHGQLPRLWRRIPGSRGRIPGSRRLPRPRRRKLPWHGQLPRPRRAHRIRRRAAAPRPVFGRSFPRPAVGAIGGPGGGRERFAGFGGREPDVVDRRKPDSVE